MSDTNTLTIDEREAQILEAIRTHDGEHEHPAQRDIAHAVGLSLGMTNAILKRLATKGFVTMQRINGRNIHYLVTPTGIDLIARRSYRYLRRTVGHIVRYKETLRSWLAEQAAAGANAVVLVGESDLEFLVEWCSEAEGMRFARLDRLDRAARDAARQQRTVVLFSEKAEVDTTQQQLGTVALAEILANAERLSQHTNDSKANA